MAELVRLDESNFESSIADFEGIAVVDFYADWCRPCHALAPHIEKLAREHPEIRVAKLDVDKAPRIAARFGVSSIPTVVRFDAGAPTATAVGALPYGQLTGALRIDGAESAAA